jgi:hypothetical protein
MQPQHESAFETAAAAEAEAAVESTGAIVERLQVLNRFMISVTIYLYSM